MDTACRLDRTSDSVRPAGSMPTSMASANRVRETGQQHGRGDARRVGNRVGVVGVAVADRDIRKGAARDVPRRNHKREAERRLAVLVGQRVDQRQLRR